MTTREIVTGRVASVEKAKSVRSGIEYVKYRFDLEDLPRHVYYAHVTDENWSDTGRALARHYAEKFNLAEKEKDFPSQIGRRFRLELRNNDQRPGLSVRLLEAL